MTLIPPTPQGRRARRAPARAWRALLPVLLPAALAAAGCSKLNPSTPPSSTTCDPSDPNNPCACRLAIGSGLPGALAALGTDTTLDLATWNMENFPTAGAASVSMAGQIIGALNLDVWAVEEIADTTAFRTLLAGLPGYAGLYSPDVYSPGEYPPYQKTGVIYRTAVVTVNSVKQILTTDYSAFPRPPLEVDLTARSSGHQYHFHLIVQHLKAGTTADDRSRRRQAEQELRTYLDAQRAADSTQQYVVAGDWNGSLSDPLASSSFPVLLSDSTHYKFLDLALAGQSFYLSHPSTGSMLDHLMVNRAACPHFSLGRVVTLRPDDYLPAYAAQMSDHRPVMVAAPVFR
ncbi:MAG TPA: endonuclease/exonuclease/phosphatase family protein [Candidatus Saccharimonadales bacterium]|nr:endonuclease/exonuclease/phosphatase family protein [Candidatus Saccharimonadales bacterium]